MKYSLTCLALLMAVLLQAQTQNMSWRFGVKTDLNFSNIQGNGNASGYTMGAQAGVFAEKPLSKNLSFQPELLFTQSNSKKGADFMTYYNTEGNVFAADNIKLGYISVPLLLKYNLNKYVSVLAGPQYSQMLFDAESLLNDTKGLAFKRYEVSGNLGAQFNVGNVAIYGRYNLGLSNINAIDNRYAWHSRHFQAGIAVKIL